MTSDLERLARPDLQRLLEEAAKRPMTPEERFEQKVSFVYGQLAFSNPDITKEQVRAHLRENAAHPSDQESEKQ